MNYRVSPSLLDQYRLWSIPDQDWKPESELIAAIKRETVATPRMKLGSSGHCAMEGAHPEHVQADGYHVCDGFRWSPETVSQCLASIPLGGIHEVKHERWIDVNRQKVQLVGIADYMLGTEITEFKFPLSAFDPNRYLESSQWKCYLTIFGASSVKYMVYTSRLDEASGEVTVSEVHPLTMLPYQNLESDVIELTDRLLTYARWKNLLPYLAAKEAA